MRSWLRAASPAAVETFRATAYWPGWMTVVCAQLEDGSAGAADSPSSAAGTVGTTAVMTLL